MSSTGIRIASNKKLCQSNDLPSTSMKEPISFAISPLLFWTPMPIGTVAFDHKLCIRKCKIDRHKLNWILPMRQQPQSCKGFGHRYFKAADSWIVSPSDLPCASPRACAKAFLKRVANHSCRSAYHACHRFMSALKIISGFSCQRVKVLRLTDFRTVFPVIGFRWVSLKDFSARLTGQQNLGFPVVVTRPYGIGTVGSILTCPRAIHVGISRVLDRKYFVTPSASPLRKQHQWLRPSFCNIPARAGKRAVFRSLVITSDLIRLSTRSKSTNPEYSHGGQPPDRLNRSRVIDPRQPTSGDRCSGCSSLAAGIKYITLSQAMLRELGVTG